MQLFAPRVLGFGVLLRIPFQLDLPARQAKRAWGTFGWAYSSTSFPLWELFTSNEQRTCMHFWRRCKFTGTCTHWVRANACEFLGCKRAGMREMRLHFYVTLMCCAFSFVMLCLVHEFSGSLLICVSSPRWCAGIWCGRTVAAATRHAPPDLRLLKLGVSRAPVCARLLGRSWPRKFMLLVKGKHELCFAC